jgi:2-keto-4-pentenoate hydratase/2-oxohepta-3-ene-1,7-dioic acid hydratase in catechol pathway
VPLAQVQLLAPLENPGSLWAAAANYKDHQAEMKTASGGPDRSAFSKDDLMAEFFLKPSSSIIGPGGTIFIPKVSNHVDYEAELCAVIGKKARNLTEAQALDCVFGYTICWDISQRDPWGRDRQNTRNIRKGFDTFTALGPWIVTKDELDGAGQVYLEISLRVNGERRQHDRTSNMLWTVDELLHYVLARTDMTTGDVLFTGTTGGTGYSDGRYLQPGDVVECEVERIGVLRNIVGPRQSDGRP